MNTLRWAPYPGVTVQSYKIFRSMIGFRAPNLDPTLLEGLTLALKLNGGEMQMITFDGVLSPVAAINAVLEGGRAYPSTSDADFFFVRSDVRQAPGSIEVAGGTSLPLFELESRLITETSEDLLIGTRAALSDPTQLLTFQDPDGAIQDFYALVTVDNLGNESLKTPYRQPVLATGNVCVIEGIVTDLQGVRMPDQEVKAFLVKYPHTSVQGSQVTTEPVSTLTGPDGRYSLTLLQGAVVQITIQSIGYSGTISVPAQPFAFITDLSNDLDYQYPLNAIGVS